MEWAIKERTMKAIDTELTKFLGAEAQYYVPIYQRKYSWKKDNCLKLIDDILKVAKDNERPCHFIGSVIYLAKQDSSVLLQSQLCYLLLGTTQERK